MKKGEKMDKVLVKLYVPMIEKTYDVWLPVNKKIYNVISLLTKAINELNNGNYAPSKMPMLYDKLTAERYQLDVSIKEMNIRNGTEIILI